MQEQRPSGQNTEIGFRLLTSGLDELAGVMKLYFTLCTGAVVLFINLLVQSRTSKLVAAPLALSIVVFSAEAAICLRLLLGLMSFRLILADAITTGALPEMHQKLEAWLKELKRPAHLLEGLFWTGMAFALIFVVAIVFGR
jgi:hypothetical protein